MMIDQVFPVRQQVPLEGLYLNERLRDQAVQLGRSLVLTDYLTDQSGVIATVTPDGNSEVPKQLKNPADWGRYQELIAQADVLLSSGSYFKRLASSQDILYPFEPGGAFETLGQWRLDAGYEKRSPDVAIVTRDLDFALPEPLVYSGRRITIFTADAKAKSEDANSLRKANTSILGSGGSGVEADRLIATLTYDMGYRVIMMTSGPQILELLLQAGHMDRIYLTEAQVHLPFTDPAQVRTLRPGGRTIPEHKDFHLAHEFVQDHVVTEDKSLITQRFLRYDRNDLER